MFRKASVCICVSMFNKALDKEAYKSCMYLFHEVCAKTDVLLKITRRTGVQFDRQPFSNSREQLCEVPLLSSKWKINVKWQQGIQVYKHELTPKYTKREVCNLCAASTNTRTCWLTRKWWLFSNRLWVRFSFRVKFTFHISWYNKYINTQVSVQKQPTYACMVALFIPFPIELKYYLWPGFLS